jgi:hypothetical protein
MGGAKSSAGKGQTDSGNTQAPVTGGLWSNIFASGKLANYENQFLNVPYSLGNWASNLATGGNAQQAQAVTGNNMTTPEYDYQGLNTYSPFGSSGGLGGSSASLPLGTAPMGGGSGGLGAGSSSELGPFLSEALGGLSGEQSATGQLPGVISSMGNTAASLPGLGSAFQSGMGTTMGGINSEESALQAAVNSKSGVTPQQQAEVEAQVNSGQSALKQQLAAMGLGSSTMGTELGSEIGLQGAATEGQLQQGDIGLLQAEQGLQIQGNQAQLQGGLQTAQEELGAQSLQATALGQLYNQYQGISQQGQQLQQQTWNEAIQGYGLASQFLQNSIAPLELNLQGNQDIEQVMEGNAANSTSVFGDELQADNGKNAAGYGSILSGIGSLVGSAYGSGGGGG